MSSVIKFLLSGLLLIALGVGYLYSKKIYVYDRAIECGQSASTFFDLAGAPVPNPIFKCDVSFKLINLTNKKISADYRIRNVTYKPTNKIQGGSIQIGFLQSGTVQLYPRLTKLVKLEIESRWSYETLKVETWVNEWSI